MSYFAKTRVWDGTNISAVSTRANTGVKALAVSIGPTDPISDIPVVMDYDHHQLHEGEVWRWSFPFDNLASGSSHNIVFTVPNIAIVPPFLNAVSACPHLRYEVVCNDLATAFFYEAPTVTAATGTARTPTNMERNGVYTVKTTILENPTITNVGTQLDIVRFLTSAAPNRAGGGSAATPYEVVLKNNTKYLFRITSGNNGLDGVIHFLWYEDLGV
jgi:hypothetical protein